MSAVDVGFSAVNTIVPALAAATAAAVAPDVLTATVQEPNDLVQLAVIAIGVIAGTIARWSTWVDPATGAFNGYNFRKDVSAMLLIGMCAWGAAVYWGLSNALVGAGTGVATYLGLGPLREWVLEWIQAWLSKRKPGP